jgi:SAM-dependent methyltransferase
MSVAGAPDFDRLSGLYRWMEWLSFGPLLDRCRSVYLDDMKSARRALVLGDGDGRFTAKLLRVNPDVRVDAADASPAMLQALVRRAGADRGRVRTIVADIREWKPESGSEYDLVVSHFFLDCLTTEEVEALAGSVKLSLTERARWVVSDFAVPEGFAGRLAGRVLVGFLYRAFGLLTGLRVRQLPDHAAALERAGFVLEKRKELLLGLLFSEVWRSRSGNASLTTPRNKDHFVGTPIRG